MSRKTHDMIPVAGKSAEEAAARVISVERTQQLLEPENASFERRFANTKCNPFLGWNPQSHLIRSYQFFDTVLDGGFKGILDSDGFIRGTGYLLSDDVLRELSIDEEVLVDVADESTIVVGCNVASGNYFHWVTQALPAMDFALRRDGQTRKVALALPILKSWQEESLRLLGHGEAKRVIIESGKQYAFSKLEFSELLNGGAAFCLSETAHKTYSRLCGSVEQTATKNRKIYVARTDAPDRRLRNENVLIEEIRNRGFEIIVPGGLTFTEQLQTFREACFVVGPHGAGMTNIVFCQPGTIVYEFLPTHYTNACFCNLASICGLRYWADAFESEGDGLPNLREWDADLAMVIERLDEIEAIRLDLQEEEKRKPIGAMDFLRGKSGQLINRESVKQAAPPPVRVGLLRRIFGRQT